MSVSVIKAESLFTGLQGSKPPHLPNLVDEINANATITTACYTAYWNKPGAPRDIAIIFASALSGPETTELDSTVIPDHTGVEVVGAEGSQATDILASGITFHMDALNRESYLGSGTVVNDFEGGTVGAITGSTTFDGVAFLFNQTSGKVDFTKDVSQDNAFAGVGTLIAVINATSDGEGTFGHIASTSADATLGWDLHVRDESGSNLDLAFLARFSTTDGEWEIPGVTIGEWVVVAIRYDSDSVSNDPDMFINGVQGTETETTTPVGTYDTDAGEQLVIGNRDADDRTFHGQIQRVMLFNRSLSDEEILQHSRTLLNRVKGVGGGWVTDHITTQTVTGTDTALTAKLSQDAVISSAHGVFNGVSKDEGATRTFTLSGVGNRTITWLASTGTAEDMDTSDALMIIYQQA